MESRKMLFSLVFVALAGFCAAYPGGRTVEQTYKVVALKKDGDSQTLILRFEPLNDGQVPVSNNHRQTRQEDEDDGEDAAAAIPATTPFIPAILPGITKIFTGILTGNLNEIFHGSSSFAPQNVSHAIDTVYNQVVGLPPPVSTARTRPAGAGPAVGAPAAPGVPAVPGAVPPQSAAAAAAATPAPVAKAPTGSVAAGQPLASITTQASVAIETTSHATSNEDDEDENESFGFGRSLGRRI